MFDFDPETIRRVLLIVPALLVAASFHEFAHGWVADRLGDGTARGMGRLTLNPIKHIDPIGSIILPLFLALMPGNFLFGWAKPVPVNPYNLRDPKTGMAWVAAAGPITNFSLAFSAAFFIRLIIMTLGPYINGSLGFFLSPILIFLTYFILINLILGLFNLMPIPPLDGGRVAVGILPTNLAEKLASLEPYGMFIIIGIMLMGVWSWVMMPVLSMLYYVLSIVAGADLWRLMSIG